MKFFLHHLLGATIISKTTFFLFFPPPFLSISIFHTDFFLFHITHILLIPYFSH